MVRAKDLDIVVPSSNLIVAAWLFNLIIKIIQLYFMLKAQTARQPVDFPSHIKFPSFALIFVECIIL